MKTRITAAMFILLLALGAAACDDTVDGIQDDAETIQSEVEEGVNDATNE